MKCLTSDRAPVERNRIIPCITHLHFPCQCQIKHRYYHGTDLNGSLTKPFSVFQPRKNNRGYRHLICNMYSGVLARGNHD